ncbi:SDR family oxidoreductase [bacterium]|nr:SDR family oxidoreductase [bacterium]
MPGRLLITGGTGTLGSHLVRMADADGRWDEIHSTYCTLNPNFHKIFWHYMDARNSISPILEKIKPDCVIHTLAMTSPDACESKKLDAWQINVETTKEIADYSHAHQIRMIFTSSDLVFDGEKGNYFEDDTFNPVSFYGDTKAEAEQIVNERMGRLLNVRISLLYGFNLNLRQIFFDQMVTSIKNKQPIVLFSDQFRTMMNVSNAAACLLELAEGEQTGLLHLGGPERISRLDFGKRLAKFLGVNAKTLSSQPMSAIKSRARRPADVSLNTDKAKSILKTRIQTIEEGFEQVFNS